MLNNILFFLIDCSQIFVKISSLIFHIKKKFRGEKTQEIGDDLSITNMQAGKECDK